MSEKRETARQNLRSCRADKRTLEEMAESYPDNLTDDNRYCCQSSDASNHMENTEGMSPPQSTGASFTELEDDMEDDFEDDREVATDLGGSNGEELETALGRLKQVESTSPIKTEKDKPKKRKGKRPNKIGDSGEDEGPSWEMKSAKKRKHQVGPIPRTTATIDSPTKKTDMDELPESPHSMTVAQNLVNGERLSWPEATWEQRNLQDTLQILLQKMETLEANQREILLLLYRSQARHREEEPVLELGVAQSQAELQDLEERLKVTEFRKRVIRHLSLTGGASPGECVRRVMRAVATNAVWSSYSLKGKKEKLPFLGTTVCSTIKQAVMKWKVGLGEREVEYLIADTLKHAPAHVKNRVQAQSVS